MIKLFSILSRVIHKQGLYSFFSSFMCKYFLDEENKIAKYLISECKSARLFLNTRVKSVNYHNKSPDKKNRIKFEHMGREATKVYDYVIITFPLTKDLKRVYDFSLDILYRDHLDCEVNYTNSCIIKGKISRAFLKDKKLTNIQMNVNDSKFLTIKALVPRNCQIKNNLMKEKIEQDIDTFPILYSVVSSEEVLNERAFRNLFLKNYCLIGKISWYSKPLYKKVKYSHTPFPQVIIDGEKRARILYLNGIEWLCSSKETLCISARNIALLIGKKEIKKDVFMSIQTKKYADEFFLNNFKMILSFSIFTSIGLIFFYQNKKLTLKI
jgi:hypothetical protein